MSALTENQKESCESSKLNSTMSGDSLSPQKVTDTVYHKRPGSTRKRKISGGDDPQRKKLPPFAHDRGEAIQTSCESSTLDKMSADSAESLQKVTDSVYQESAENASTGRGEDKSSTLDKMSADSAESLQKVTDSVYLESAENASTGRGEEELSTLDKMSADSAESLQKVPYHADSVYLESAENASTGRGKEELSTLDKMSADSAESLQKVTYHADSVYQESAENASTGRGEEELSTLDKMSADSAESLQKVTYHADSVYLESAENASTGRGEEELSTLEIMSADSAESLQKDTDSVYQESAENASTGRGEDKSSTLDKMSADSAESLQKVTDSVYLESAENASTGRGEDESSTLDKMSADSAESLQKVTYHADSVYLESAENASTGRGEEELSTLDKMSADSAESLQKVTYHADSVYQESAENASTGRGEEELSTLDKMSADSAESLQKVTYHADSVYLESAENASTGRGEEELSTLEIMSADSAESLQKDTDSVYPESDENDSTGRGEDELSTSDKMSADSAGSLQKVTDSVYQESSKNISVRKGIDMDDSPSEKTPFSAHDRGDGEQLSTAREETLETSEFETEESNSQTFLTIIPEKDLPKINIFEPFKELGTNILDKKTSKSLCVALKADEAVKKYAHYFEVKDHISFETLESLANCETFKMFLNGSLGSQLDDDDIQLLRKFISHNSLPALNDVIKELYDEKYTDLLKNYVNFSKFEIPVNNPLHNRSKKKQTEIPMRCDVPYLPLFNLPKGANNTSKVEKYIRDRIGECAKIGNNYNCSVLFGVSGCGKTSSIFRYLALNYGIYFEVGLPKDTSGQLSPDMIYLTQKADQLPPDERERKTEHYIKCLLLGRILLLRVFQEGIARDLEKANVQKAKIIHAWLHLQLRLNEVKPDGTNLLLIQLFLKLCQYEEKEIVDTLRHNVEMIITYNKTKSNRFTHRNAVPVFIDEAQILTRVCKNKYEDSQKNPRTRALFSKVFKVLNSLPQAMEGIRIATFVSGTAITLTHEIKLIHSAIAKAEAEVPANIVFKNFPRMLERSKMEKYVGHFINFTKLHSRELKLSKDSRDVVNEVYTEFKGRPRFLGFFIATCLRSTEIDERLILTTSIDQAKKALIGGKGSHAENSIRHALEKSVKGERTAEVNKGKQLIPIVDLLRKLVLSYYLFGEREEHFTAYWEEDSVGAELIDEGICYLRFDKDAPKDDPISYGVQEPLVVKAIEEFILDKYDPNFCIMKVLGEGFKNSSMFSNAPMKGYYLELMVIKWMECFFSDESKMMDACDGPEHFERLKGFRLVTRFGGSKRYPGVICDTGEKCVPLLSEAFQKTEEYKEWSKLCKKNQNPFGKGDYLKPSLHRYLLEPFCDFLLPDVNAGPDLVFLLDNETSDEQKLCLVQCKFSTKSEVGATTVKEGYHTTDLKLAYQRKEKKGQNFAPVKNCSGYSQFCDYISEKTYRAHEIGTVRILICMPRAHEYKNKIKNMSYPSSKVSVEGKDITFMINMDNLLEFGASAGNKHLLQFFFGPGSDSWGEFSNRQLEYQLKEGRQLDETTSRPIGHRKKTPRPKENKKQKKKPKLVDMKKQTTLHGFLKPKN